MGSTGVLPVGDSVVIKHPDTGGVLEIARNIVIPMSEIEIKAVRSGGPGGQNVNKVATAIHLKFDIGSSSLPEEAKQKLRNIRDRRITENGVIVLKAQRFRTQAKNRSVALARLAGIIRAGLKKRKKRIPTRPSPQADQKRLDAKSRRSEIKRMRRNLRSGE